jgi:hypothetical protein
VVIGVAMIASRRSAMFGRAPSIHDVNVAVALFGFTSEAPSELVAYRKRAFSGVSHDYEVQRALVDGVPEDTLRLPTAAVLEQSPAAWRDLLGGDTAKG